MAGEDEGPFVGVGAGAGEEDAAGEGFDFHFEADALEHLAEDLADFFIGHVAVVAAGDGHAEALGVAGFGEEGAGAGGVVGEDGERRVEAAEAWWDELGCGDGVAFEGAEGKGAAVDGEGDGLSDADVFQGICGQGGAGEVGEHGHAVEAGVGVEEHDAVAGVAVQGRCRACFSRRFT